METRVSIVPTTIVREVVKETAQGTTYVCDQCGERWDIGRYEVGVNSGSLHPSKDWWRLAPADSSTLWEDQRTKHLCSRACLAEWSHRLTD